ncbi:hypothetical protein [Synechococcus sp. PCC 7336]|uniref:hypothetical protein n=1 Tax=Synechococcus sp. PCC 7336 TaxID=195250 RepID=UPI000349AB96|nr:hypothetical protein [Synechococcus sp. PCC 7336]
MEYLQQERVSELQQQLELLKQSIERLPAAVVAELQTQAIQPPAPILSTGMQYGSAEEMQGILLDEDMTAERQARTAVSQAMLPEAQIQRLTAQLTAAYNRIAALEEQLLSQRLQ